VPQILWRSFKKDGVPAKGPVTAMWIFCCGMPRSASTLQFQIVSKLVEEARKGQRIEWAEHYDFPKIRAKYREYQGWKVFKVHIPTEEILSEFDRNNAKGIYIYRDIRDAVVSNIRRLGIESNMPKRKEMIGKWCKKWIKYHNQWTAFPQTMVSRYETTVGDIFHEVQRIAAHLDISLTHAECRQIADEFSLEKQVRRIEKMKNESLPKLGDRNETVIDPHSLLHSNHIYSGKNGQWKDFLSPDELNAVNNLITPWLKKKGYPIKKENLK
jgi:hypothetical protein